MAPTYKKLLYEPWTDSVGIPILNEIKVQKIRNEIYAVLDSLGVASSHHHTTHENGGTDEINIDGLSGHLADAQDPTNHSPSVHTTTMLNAWSDNLVPLASARFYLMTNNSVTLTPGTWLLFGRAMCGWNGVSPDYISGLYVWSTANGDNTAVAPPYVTTKAGVPTGTYISFSLGFARFFEMTCEPIIVAVAANTSVYLVPFAEITNVANSLISTSVSAIKIGNETT